jgi:transposase
MNETETALIENAKEYFRNATSAEKRKEYNTAVTLFFKTLAALADLMIYRKEGRLPSSHTERFRTLEEKYPDTYQKLDQNFSFYQDSYRRKMDAEISALLREDAKRLYEQLGISM